MAGRMTDLQRYLPARLPTLDRMVAIVAFKSNCDICYVFRTLFRKNAVYLTAIFAGAFAFELSFDTASNKIWDSWNAGRQWKDIKPRYLVAAEEEDDD
ncbi:ubiquinol-cytochrome C reductase [Penicillium verhagenii]|uniref:ubiquinol-cytochrome C reductase n=1 Tax=Penicillium verhagenii TaxID=1562060 RepID=UPI00254585F2|nr:ubiquinol-cytochrome C reductase [Penicillium verhagenii]KAJ5923620.1 ubiquinol-cytochrome C reductase [Penicillium verhagenii]KAJ5928535.1 ubiquinol-cytochrome C reductase [Penicillium verhagenii]